MEHEWTTGNVLVTNVLHLIRPEIIIKEFIILRHQVLQDPFQCILAQGLLSQEMKIEKRAQFQCRHKQEGPRDEFINTGRISTEFCGWTAKTANVGNAI